MAAILQICLPSKIIPKIIRINVSSPIIKKKSAPICRTQYQSSIFRSSTLSNSRTLWVTIVKPPDFACAAIKVSIGPIGVPFRFRVAHISPYSAAALPSNGRTFLIARLYFSRDYCYSSPHTQARQELLLK